MRFELTKENSKEVQIIYASNEFDAFYKLINENGFKLSDVSFNCQTEQWLVKNEVYDIREI